MYERLLDKSITPDERTIQEYLGRQSHERLTVFEDRLKANYQIGRELKFPFGSSYGWGYKYNHKSSHLCYVFFEKNAFTVTFQIGDRQAPLLESRLPSLSQKTRDLWNNRYPCGERGGWVHYRVLTDEELADILKLLAIRKKPSVKNG